MAKSLSTRRSGRRGRPRGGTDPAADLRSPSEPEPGGLVVETVGGDEHEDRHAAAGGDDAFGDLVTGGPGNVSVQDCDVVDVDAQQLQSCLAVACGVCRDRFRRRPSRIASAIRGSSSTINTRTLRCYEPAHIVGISKTAYVLATPRSV
jgi:hypothetical protein